MLAAPEENAMSPPTEQRRHREVRHYAYVDRDFGQVRSYLTAAPERLLRERTPPRDAGGGLRTGLHLHRAGLDVSRDVRVVLGDLLMSARSVRAPLHWEDASRPGLFPVLDATLELIPVASGRHHTTQIGFVGRYETPLGWLGAVADSLAGNRLVLESVEEFVEGLAGRLERELPDAPPVVEKAERHHERPPGRLRRVFLPVEDLDRRPGSAVEVLRRLEAEPGVVTVKIEPPLDIAVVEYDATVCGLSRLLGLLDPVPAEPNER
jgi:hypothetical protein